ncbi:hypothetical protein Tco_1113782 [Tanacetum coccineum]|uniref:Uncharacterized protein n=1 Tax=Tanacetum coccineum TaxID=301880 RepID=A0ABQ5IT98_9ASTR
MEHENQQQAAQDEALVPIDDQVKIGACNLRIDPICMQQFCDTISKNKSTFSYQFQLDNQKFEFGVMLFHEILQITPRVPNQKFVEPPPRDALVSFVKQLDAMMNDEIKNSVPYLTYLDLSTNTEVDIPKVGKGHGKGVMRKKKAEIVIPKEKKKAITPRKKSSITADDNILPDPNEALKLEAKGIETLSKAAQYIYDMKTASKASKLDYKIQQQSKGSSEGSGIILEVPNEPNNISGSSSSSLFGFDDEIEDVSSDDKVKVEENKAKEGKDTKEQAKEEPPVDNQDRMEPVGGEQAKV